MLLPTASDTLFHQVTVSFWVDSRMWTGEVPLLISDVPGPDTSGPAPDPEQGRCWLSRPCGAQGTQSVLTLTESWIDRTSSISSSALSAPQLPTISTTSVATSPRAKTA